MKISFKAIGLSFEAEVTYTPITPGKFTGPPEDCYPDEGGDVEFETLECEGNDALFLLDSRVADDIYEAAMEAAYEEAEC